ncbi:MAG: hypothetical protein A4E30_00234 [Methanomassiliicoccales archaeon PtaB.Bin215]|nr:MAG: hypothetical protein A4E30_00234 [Methanomassiliicoccales archaeon PtaB.Bin215]
MGELAIGYGARGLLDADRVWLSSGFRVQLIKLGIEKAGSVNELGRRMGYRSRVHPGWGVVQIMQGKQAFPVSRLKLLAEFLDYPLDDILPYVTHPNRVTPESTKSALAMYGLSGYIPR